MRKNINKIKIALSIALVFLGIMGMGNNPPDTCIAPVSQPTGLSFTASQYSINGTFTASASADHYLIVRCIIGLQYNAPVNTISYSQGDTIGGGIVISYQAGTNFLDSNLNSSSFYAYTIFAANSLNCSNGPFYLTQNPLMGSIYFNGQTPSMQPILLNIVQNNNIVSGSFTSSIGADYYLIVKSNTNAFTPIPENGILYAKGNTIGNATVFSYQTGTTFIDSSQNSTQCYYYIYAAKSASYNGNPSYLTANPLRAKIQTVCLTPTLQPTALNLKSGIASASGSFEGTAVADHYLIVRSTSNTLNATPIDGVIYNRGDLIGGGIVVSYQETTTFNDIGLSDGQTYYYFIFAANSNCTGTPTYLAANPLSSNATIPAKTIQAWIFPDNNTIYNANPEILDGRKLDVLKPQYYTLLSDGTLEFINYWTTANGYSEQNASTVLNLQGGIANRPGFITISASGVPLKNLLISEANRIALKNTIINNITNYSMNLSKFTGIELDFEAPAGNWNAYNNWTNYQSFISLLGNSLHSIQKQLIITLPPGLGSKFSFFKDNESVDMITIMCYDDQVGFSKTAPIKNDFGPLAPNQFTLDAINEIISKMVTNSQNPTQNLNKIVIGMPSYGYHAIKSCVNPPPCDSIALHNDAKVSTVLINNYLSAQRNPLSYEMSFRKNNNPDSAICYYQDAIGMSEKVEFIRSNGINHVSVWHLGGNDWFSKFDNSTYTSPTVASGWGSTSSNALTNNAYTANTSTTNAELILNNFSFPTINSTINGIELVIIGHSSSTSTLKTTLGISLCYDGTNYTTEQDLDIYSNHDVIRFKGSATDLWGKVWSGSSFALGAFKVKIRYKSGSNPSINAVYAKVYSNVLAISAANDDAASAYIPGSSPIYNNGLPDFTHHRFGLYKKNATTDGKYFENGFRFQNVNIPEGSVINSAYLDLYHRASATNTNDFFTVNFGVVNNSNTTTFSDSQNNRPSDKPLLPNVSVPFTFNPEVWGVAPDGHSMYRYIDVTNLVQAITSSSNGWVENNPITIIGKLANPPNSPITSSNCVGYSTFEGGVGVTRLIIDFTPPPPCNYSNNHEIINNTTTVWSDPPNNPRLIYNDVYVSPGAVLTITGTVKFTEQATLYVQPGAKLIINGGTLTNLCNNKLWQGIVIRGYDDISQFSQNSQGKVILSNEATISNAVCGISTMNLNYPFNKGCGIIQAYNANFIDNQTAVKLLPYTNKSLSGGFFNDISTFKNCNFITDNNYITPATTPFQQFINLDKIKGIEIMGCRFKNLSTNIASNFSNAGIGINSNESYYNIDNYINQTEFHNLQYGIKSISVLTTKPIQVKRALFNNNFHGIYAKNYNKVWLTANTFKIPYYYIYYNNGDGTTGSAYGMYLDYCTGYIVEGNNFNKADNIVRASYGIVINASGEADNRIYNNTFSNILFGATQVQGTNRNNPVSTPINPVPEHTGLEIKCNDYFYNQRDISITYTPDIITNANTIIGIKKYQGSYASSDDPIENKKPAGNLFSHYTNQQSDFNNPYMSSDYYYHKQISLDSWVPFDYYGLNPLATLGVYTNKDEVCPGIALQTGTPQPYPYQASQVSSIIQGKTAQLNTSKLIYSLWVDNGNTEGLRHDIKISLHWESFDLYNKLLLGSPNLSEEVLIDAIKREDVLTPLMIKLILLANPQSTRSDRVWEALLNRVNPLPEAWLDEIKQGLEVISPIENMQADISYYASERNTYMNLLKQCYLSDTTETGMQQYISLLDSESDIESKYELVFAKISNQDYEGALISLASIEEMIDNKLQPEELDRYNKMSALIPVLIGIESDNINWENLSEKDRNMLINFSETDRGKAGSLATAERMILDAGFIYEEPIYLPSDRPLKMSLPKKGKTAVANEKHIKISPNPATDYIAIECNIEGFGTNLRLQITDALGKTVLEKELGKTQQIIDIREFAKGSYYCTVYNNGKALNSVKFIKK